MYAFPRTKQSPRCKCVRGHHAISKLKDFYPLQSVIKAWKGFLLRDCVFDGFSLFTINLGLKYCGLSLLDWNNWTTISGTITSVLCEVPGPNLESVHTRWKIKRETITTWWLPWRGILEFHRQKRRFASPSPWVAKPAVGGLGKDLTFSLSGLSFFLMPGLSYSLPARVELDPTTQG